MTTDHRERLAGIQRFDQLVAYLRDELGWPIDSDDFEELTFDYTPEELGIDEKNAAKIENIRRLRPLVPGQPWGIFFVKFEPKRLPVVALRRILGRVAVKKRASANASERPSWDAGDLLFVSNYGDGDQRRIAFAHFAKPHNSRDLPTLKVLGWDDLDTPLRLDAVARDLTTHLVWPDDEADVDAWREGWRAAFKLRYGEVIANSKQLSERLAELARLIRDSIRAVLSVETEAGQFTRLMKAFQATLLHDLQGAAFADMYAQTIAYGLLSARIADPNQRTADDLAAHMRTNPFLKELLEIFLRAGGRRGVAADQVLDLDELGVSEVVDLLDQANMEDILRDFGDRNRREDPVIYFYEDFLEAYDKDQKISRGVFYTPRPVVSYIVRSVDELLRTEFGLADGLADTTTWGDMAKRREDLKIPNGTLPNQAFVQILDPATGTGTFLVDVIDVIYRTMVKKWAAQGHGNRKIQALWNNYVPKHLLPRLHGYELLMAPYAIAHLKIGLKLYETGYRFDSEQRARVYLTNALEPASDLEQMELAGILPAVAHEAQAVNVIKKSQRFTVLIGNPPYSEKSKNDGGWIGGLMERYKTTIRSEEAQIKAVSNDYVKFLCLMHSLASLSGKSIVGVITGHGYLDGRLFRDLRRSWIASFNGIDIVNLHGSGRRGDAAVDDENVFDILQGVSIAIVRQSFSAQSARIRYSELLGSRVSKYKRLVQHSVDEGVVLGPETPLFLFSPSVATQSSLRTWPLSAIFGTGDPRKDRNRTYAGGFKTRQDKFTVGFDELTLRTRIAELADITVTESQLRKKYRLCSTAHFEFHKARQAAQLGELRRSICNVRYRPFDDRLMIWAREVLCEPQERVTRHLFQPNLCLATSRVVKDDAFRHVSITRGPVEVISLSNSTSTNAYMFPLYRYEFDEALGTTREKRRIVNLSPRFIAELEAATRMRISETMSNFVDDASMSPEEIVGYIYAILHSPSYRRMFADDLLRDFPAIPIPSGAKQFRAIAGIGGVLLSLHLLESPKIEKPTTDLVGGRTPKVDKISWSFDTVWVDKAQSTGFRGVREDVWNFQIGGYQVCHKWLKDRKGRTLSVADIAHYQKVVVALSETIRIMGEIDVIIEAHGGWPGAFQSGQALPDE